MNETPKDSTELAIILATSLSEERESLINLLQEQNLNYKIHSPKNLLELDTLSKESSIDLIITDFEYQNGSLVDWLVLWPYPFIILASPDSSEKLSSVLSDEASTFLIRRADGRHINFIPCMIKKVLGIRASQKVQNNFIKISEKQYMNLVQALPDIIYVLDSNGNFTFINNEVRSLGWEPVELIGKHFSILLYNDDIPKVSRKSILPSLRGKVTGGDRSPKLFDEHRTGSRMTRGLIMKLKRKPTIGGSIDVSLISYGEILAFGYSGFQDSEITELGTAGIIRENINVKNTKSKTLDAESIFSTSGALSHDQVMHLLNNKLQVLGSLISLKQGLCEDTLSCSSLNEVQIQIYTLSLVYQNMVTVNSEIRVRMETYLNDIVKHLMSSHSENPWIQQVDIHCSQIYLDEDSAINVSLFINEIITLFLKIEDHLDINTTPLTITFIVNNGISQLKFKTSEKIFSAYNELIKDDNSTLLLKTFAEILKGEIFADKNTLTLFFNVG